MNAPEVPAERWLAMTRLDENRARIQLAKKAKVPVNAISNVAIWGNHSTTQYPDARNARIAGLPVFEVITDHGWLKGKFIETVQKRGAAVIEARGASSAASAANAAIDSVVSVRTPTPWGDWHSLAVVSHGEYGCRTAFSSDSRCALTESAGRWSPISSTTTTHGTGSRRPPRNCCRSK